jgi:putative two-component system response regulator
MHTRWFLDARILIVDDDRVRVRLLAELLRLGGYMHVRTEIDPRNAVGLFGSYQPDLVILDLHMGPIDGFQVLEEIEPLTAENSYLPVLVVTGDVCPETKERALSAGAMDFIAKPFNVSEILLRVKNLLHTRLLHMQLQHERDVLEERVRERTGEVVEAHDEMLSRLAAVAEYHDDATGDHAKRVGNMVYRIALEMGFTEEGSELCGRAALLHDIGKVSVPDVVLQKLGKVTEDEFDQIKRHTAIGGDILRGSRSRLLKIAETIARYHHERWNGTGYEGLEGLDIPFEARLTAVADVYDALISPRPYKEGWKHEMAVAEIQRLSGTHFDPAVVDAFLRIVEIPQVVANRSRGYAA